MSAMRVSLEPHRFIVVDLDDGYTMYVCPDDDDSGANGYVSAWIEGLGRKPKLALRLARFALKALVSKTDQGCAPDVRGATP